MTDLDPRVPALWANIVARLERLERAQQLGASTVGDTDEEAVTVEEVVADAANTTATVVNLEDGVASANDGVSVLGAQVAASMGELDARLELADVQLDVAREEIEEAQAQINQAFGQQVEGLSADVDTAISAAGDAKTEAEAASDAALAAAGLAASKGKTIVQVTAPSGANADPANLWIDISTDSNGVPKNQPNRYNPDTAKWEPVSDAKAVAAAQSAATAVAAAQAAKDVADQANAAAGVAKTTADNANTAALQAAGIANGKGKVISQTSKPTGANAAAGNLWIRTTDNTPWVYDTSIPDWVQVTDKNATDAAAAAVTAQQAATAAANAAAAAQATADSKPLILFSSTAGPSGTAPTGSTWFLWDSAKNIAGQWLQSGTLANPVWTPQQIRSEVIANLDLGKLTAGSAAIADLVAQKIAASTANFQTVNVSNLFVTQGATLTQAVIDYLFANVVMAKKITAGMIDVDSLSGVTLTGVKYRSAASGSRIEISGTVLAVYSASQTKPVGGIQAIEDGDFSAIQIINSYSSLGQAGISLGVPRNPGAGTYESSRKLNAQVTSGLQAPVLQASTFVTELSKSRQYPIIDGTNADGTGRDLVTADVFRVGTGGAKAVAFGEGSNPTAPTSVVVQANDFRVADGTSIAAPPYIEYWRTTDFNWTSATTPLDFNTSKTTHAAIGRSGAAFVVNTAGLYYVTATAALQKVPSASVWANLYCYINGTAYKIIAPATSTTVAGAAVLSFAYRFAAGDTFDFRIRAQATVAGYPTNDNASATYMSAVRLGN